METLATPASTPRNPESKTVLDYRVRYMGETSHHDTCIVYTKDLYQKSSEKLNMINMIIVYKAGRFFFRLGDKAELVGCRHAFLDAILSAAFKGT